MLRCAIAFRLISPHVECRCMIERSVRCEWSSVRELKLTIQLL